MAIRTPAELKVAVAAMFADNNAGDIIPADARDFLSDQIDSAVPSVGGSDVLNEIRHINGAWKAISTKSQEYMVVTRADDFATLRIAIIRGLQTGGAQANYESGLPSLFQFRARSTTVIGAVGASGGRPSAPLGTMWPVGDAPPWVWLLTPSSLGYLARTPVRFRTWPDQFRTVQIEETEDAGILPYTITIDGVPYDVARNRTSLARPDIADAADPTALDASQFRISYLYLTPPVTSPVVLQVT